MHVSSLSSRYYYSPQSRSIGLLGHTNHLDAPIALFAVRIVLIRLVHRALITVECDDDAILMRYKSKPRIEQYRPHFSNISYTYIIIISLPEIVARMLENTPFQHPLIFSNLLRIYG